MRYENGKKLLPYQPFGGLKIQYSTFITLNKKDNLRIVLGEILKMALNALKTGKFTEGSATLERRLAEEEASKLTYCNNLIKRCIVVYSPLERFFFYFFGNNAEEGIHLSRIGIEISVDKKYKYRTFYQH